MASHLSRAIETYQRELPKLLGDEGKFVLICDDRLVGVYGTYEDALTFGYERFGMQPFLVKRIQAVEQVHQFARPLSPTDLCPT